MELLMVGHQLYKIETARANDVLGPCGGGTVWRWKCECGVTGKWQAQHPSCCKPAHARHVTKKWKELHGYVGTARYPRRNNAQA